LKPIASGILLFVTYGPKFGLKIESMGYPTVKRHDSTVIRFDSIPACDRQTDGQMDTPLIAESRI